MIDAALHDWLAARLDLLGAAKEVAETAAVIGREFPALIRAATRLKDGECRLWRLNLPDGRAALT